LPEYLHHLVSQVVDHFDGDAPGGGFGEGPRGVAVERRPGVFVDLGLEGGLERLVGILGAEEIGVADEEALFVVVGVDEPAGDALGAVAAHLAGAGMEDIHAVDLDRIRPSSAGRMSMSGSPKMTNRLPLPVFFRSSAMCRSAFMRALSTGMRPSLLNSAACAS
jgi:hypothetical protein